MPNKNKGPKEKKGKQVWLRGAEKEGMHGSVGNCQIYEKTSTSKAMKFFNKVNY